MTPLNTLREEYETPSLTVLGTLAEITRKADFPGFSSIVPFDQ